MIPWWLAVLIVATLLLGFGSVVVVIGNFIERRAANGRHRKSAAEIHSSSDESTDHSPGGAAPLGPTSVPAGSATFSGTIPLGAGPYSGRMMAHPHLAPPSYLGAGHSSALQRQAMQYAQAQQMMQMQQQSHYNQMMLARMAAHAGLAASVAPHAKTTLKSDGIRAGEIIAWRAWIIAGDDLRSATASAIWNPAEPMQGDAAGGFGIHAYKNPHGPMMDGYADSEQNSEWVIGEVALWGDVIEHERGYRAEYGRVHSLVTWSRRVNPMLRVHIEKKYISGR